MMRRPLCGCVLVCCIIAAQSAFAQRRPVTPPGQAKRGQQVPATSGLLVAAPAPNAGGDVVAPPAGRVRTLGAWVDDASALRPGEVWLALSASRWEMPVATGSDRPVIDFSAGLTPRVQVSISVPFYQMTDRSGGTFRGLGDFYAGSKIVWRDAATRTLGVSFSPTLELLSESSTAGTGLGRVNWILPVSLERRFDAGRVYGSTGYFSRGVLFASGAYEHAVSDKLALTGVVTHAYATDRDALSSELGLSRRRVDVSGTASYVVAPALTLFGSLGRTVFGLDADSTRMLASAGVAVNMR